MKKIWIISVALALVLCLAGCAAGGNLKGDAAENEGMIDGGNPDDHAENNAENADPTIGRRLADDFKALLNLDNMMGARALVDELLKSDYLSFESSTTEVKPGKLKGFGDKEITGFKEGVMFAPAKGDTPFIAYVFTLEEKTDADRFIADLKSSADVRWNESVKADEMVAEGMGRMVFFAMSPKSLEK